MHFSKLNRTFAAEKEIIKNNIMVSAAFKNRTRDEVIAAFRESIRKKHEWEAQTQEVFDKIREERRQLSL